MSRFALFAIIVIVAAGIWFLFFSGEQTQPLPEQEQTETVISPSSNFVTINGARLKVEVVRNPQESARGLGGRDSLDENKGMLFVLDEPTFPGFWMKDMRFALDFIWIDEEGKVVGITENVAPETYPEIFTSSVPVLHMLEVNAGWAQDHNISVGDAVLLNFAE